LRPTPFAIGAEACSAFPKDNALQLREILIRDHTARGWRRQERMDGGRGRSNAEDFCQITHVYSVTKIPAPMVGLISRDAWHLFNLEG
jgi:hypothetical protein